MWAMLPEKLLINFACLCDKGFIDLDLYMYRHVCELA